MLHSFFTLSSTDFLILVFKRRRWFFNSLQFERCVRKSKYAKPNFCCFSIFIIWCISENQQIMMVSSHLFTFLVNNNQNLIIWILRFKSDICKIFNYLSLQLLMKFLQKCANLKRHISQFNIPSLNSLCCCNESISILGMEIFFSR